MLRKMCDSSFTYGASPKLICTPADSLARSASQLRMEGEYAFTVIGEASGCHLSPFLILCTVFGLLSRENSPKTSPPVVQRSAGDRGARVLTRGKGLHSQVGWEDCTQIV